MTHTLSGKVALVTGGARGIGAAIAKAFAAEGAAVAITYHEHGAEASSVVADVVAAGSRIAAIKADVATEEDATASVRETVARFGALDILVNNAGVILEKPLLETTTADFDWLMSINLRGTFMTGREAIRHMVSAGSGRVVNIASDLGYFGREQFSVYCASKAAILNLTKSWAKEFAPNILVNAIAPGPIDTDMLDLANMSPEWRKKEEMIPMARIGQPKEVAAAAVFLAGPSASFMTGQTIDPNGGSVMP
ncbi:SDR family NAD(P)-dependent oxidoreductase [Dongia deserti]|uniref:SDR family NAD(P)-dependent oxidoreductase n=1 Tax=Dongia deserti TaxID=2268030 RepID=UPI000E651C9E|nr:glucose 1-dehydrogenase [Dongia deserti]